MSEKRRSKSNPNVLVWPFVIVAIFLILGSVAALTGVAVFGFNLAFVGVAVAMLGASAFFSVLALFSTRWKGSMRAKATRSGVEVRLGVQRELKENRRLLARNASAKGRG